jgi:hypothetical protein
VEHGIDSCSQTRFFRQLKKESERFIGDAVLGVIQVKTNGLDRQTLTALRIIRKKLLQMELLLYSRVFTLKSFIPFDLTDCLQGAAFV